MSDNRKRVGLVSIMPRSGTWYTNMFFWFYVQLLKGKTNLQLNPECLLLYVGDIAGQWQIDLGVNELLICHAECPGFGHYRGEHRQAWDELNYHVEGFNVGESRLKISEREDFDPVLNKNVRIAYCYRNPLDQAVSFFQHIQNHVDATLRCYVDSDGKQHSIENVREYILNVGLESYIKQFLTFKVMKQMCPDNILLIKYETLATEPARVFAGILDHLGHDIGNPSNQQKMAQAMALSSKDSIKRIERTIGHSIGGDQVDPNESHIRGGEIGKWKKHLNNDDLEEIQERLARFGLSLDDFDIAQASVEQIVS